MFEKTNYLGELKTLSLFLILLNLIACSKKKDVTHIDFNEASKFSEWVQNRTIELIPLETSKKNLVGDFTNLKKFNNDFYVFSLNEQVIHRFTQQGNYLNSIGQNGDAEGQYRNASNFMISNDTVSILCNYGHNSRIYNYSINGSYINYEELHDVHFYDLEKISGLEFYSSGSNTSSGSNFRVAKIMNGKYIGVIELGLNKSMTLQESNFNKTEKTLLYHDSFDNRVYKITKDSSWVSHKFSFGEYNLKPSYFEGGDFYQNFDKMLRNGIAVIRNYLETESTTYLNLVKQNQKNSEFFHLFLDKNNSQLSLVEALSGRAPAFLIEDSKLVLLIHAGDLIESMDKFSRSRNFEDLKMRVSKLSMEDNPVLLKIPLNE